MSPMRYGPNLLEEILRRTDIVQLVGRKVKLTRRGQAMWGCCPFHKEKSPSFKVENGRRTYKCFGCGKGGDAFKWLMETEGLTFPEAVEKLAGEAGVALPAWTPEDEAREEKKKSLYDVIEAACAFFEMQLREAGGRAARDYLKSRGLDEAAAKRFRLGYAPSNNQLIEHLKTKNTTVDDMIAAGLARPGELRSDSVRNDRGTRDFFFNRITFPITDPRGRVVAFGARALEPDAKPKYINTGDTTLFSKGRQLYNFALARPAGLRAQTIIVAEGYMDVIALVRAGFEASVAPLGTALTEDQLQLLWRVAPEPVMAFDGDDAGLRAAHRAARLALPALKPGHSLRFAFVPPGEDPDSLIRASGPAAMQKILDAAEPLVRVLWRVETEGKDFSTPERRAGLERALSDIVSLIGDGKIADYYRREFDQLVFDSFKRRQPAAQARQPYRGPDRGQRRGERGERFVPQGPAVSAALKNSLLVRSGGQGAQKAKEMELARLLLEDPEIASRHSETLAAIHFSDPLLDRLRQELLNLAASGFRLEKGGLDNHLVRIGMAELVERLKAHGAWAPADQESAEDEDARFLRAAAQLREMAELTPERNRAVERFKSEPSEESWHEAQRLLGIRSEE
ncbi:MAG: DNA primase [Alphaproteobacteria bacterium]|nr:DNA primase [Alphaproteobacteria bacterium]